MTDPIPVGHYEESVPANYSQHFDSIVGVTRLDESVMEHILIKIVSIRRNAYCSGERSSLLLQKIEIL